MKTLETPRLILRSFVWSDLPAFNHYAKKAAIGPNAGWKPHESIQESEAILAKFIEGQEVWAVTSKRDGCLLGSIGLHPDNHRRNPKARSIGYVLDDEYWGHGYITEATRRVIRFAFEELELDLVTVTHYPFNDRSRRVIERCGFIYEATLKQATVRYDGVVLDEVLYYLDREQYQKIKNVM